MSARPDPAALLGGVAEALTACEQAGIRVKLKHGVVYTPAGYVLPAADGWVARTLQWSEFSRLDDEDEEP